MIKNVIFDWSGVISDDLFPSYKTIMEIFKKLGNKEMPLEEFKKEWEQPYMRFYDKYGIKTDKLSLEKQKEFFGDIYKEMFSRYPVKLFHGIKETLEKLKKAGINMIVVSANLKETISDEIEKFGLQGIFDEINSDIHDKVKDIKETVERNGFNPQETIFIGDTVHEIKAGKSCGIKTGAVTWGYNTEEKLRANNPDYLIHDLEELENVVLKKP